MKTKNVDEIIAVIPCGHSYYESVKTNNFSDIGQDVKCNIDYFDDELVVSTPDSKLAGIIYKNCKKEDKSKYNMLLLSKNKIFEEGDYRSKNIYLCFGNYYGDNHFYYLRK